MVISRPPTPRTLLLAIALILIAGVLGVRAADEPSPSPVNPICDWAFSQAATGADATIDAVDQEIEPAASAAAVGVEPDPALDETVRMCGTVAEFEAAAATYPGVFGTTDPTEFLRSRCTDPAADLAAYGACMSVERVLAVPSPSPTLTPTETPAPSATATHDEGSATATQRGSKARSDPKPIRSRRAFRRAYCRDIGGYHRQLRRNSDLGLEVGKAYAESDLPSASLAESLRQAAARSIRITNRFERLRDYSPTRNLVRLHIRLLRVEAAMLSLYAELAIDPIEQNLDRAERVRTKAGQISTRLTSALLRQSSRGNIDC